MSGCSEIEVDRPLLERLESWRGRRAVILGVGNPLKGDDAAGPLVCELLGGPLSAKVIDGGSAPENHLRPIREADPEVLLIVDAVDLAGQVGQIHLLGPEQVSRFSLSTHALSLHLLIDLLRRENDLAVHLIGIQVRHVQLGRPLSPEVNRAAHVLANTLREVFRPATEPRNPARAHKPRKRKG